MGHYDAVSGKNTGKTRLKKKHLRAGTELTRCRLFVFIINGTKSSYDKEGEGVMQQKRLSPGRWLALGFSGLILVGALLLSLPFSRNQPVSWVDLLFTSASAVCVTGLTVVNTWEAYSAFGQFVIAALIQLGGLGFASFGVGIMLMARQKINFRERRLVKEAINYPSFNGILHVVRFLLKVTLICELAGSICSFFVFVRNHSVPQAVGMGMFHAVSSFNNAGFDILPEGTFSYRGDPLFYAVTCALIIVGGLGFMVIYEVVHHHKFGLHTKVVLSMTGFLLFAGTLLLLVTERFSLEDAFFYSVSARTAGFAVHSCREFSMAGISVMIVLMLMGASPGSTGGGIKTTTTFVLFRSLFAYSSNNQVTGFQKRIPAQIVYRSFILLFSSLVVIGTVTFLLCLFEPDLMLHQLLFETVSAFGTVGLSTGITAELSWISKLILSMTMLIGRLGPLTVATLWVYHPETAVSRPEGLLLIG